jgi:hypothetical protein
VSLLLPRFLGPDGLLILELPVVHDLADRRICERRDLDEVEPVPLGLKERLLPRNDPDLGTIRTDQSYFRGANTVVDPILRRRWGSSSLRYATSLLAGTA